MSHPYHHQKDSVEKEVMHWVRNAVLGPAIPICHADFYLLEKRKKKKNRRRMLGGYGGDIPYKLLLRNRNIMWGFVGSLVGRLSFPK